MAVRSGAVQLVHGVVSAAISGTQQIAVDELLGVLIDVNQREARHENDLF